MKSIALPTALTNALIGGFYRRNFFFFTLLLVFTAFICRPPTLLVSPTFVGPMLEDLRFFGGVWGLLLLYQTKVWRDNLRTLSLPGHEFLYALGTLPSSRLLAWLMQVSMSTMAPALLYGGVVAGYSLIQGTPHLWILLFSQGAWCIGASLHLRHRILFPHEGKSGRQGRLRRWQLSLAFPLWQTLWQKQRRPFLIHKALIAGLLIGVAQYHQFEPFSAKGMDLVLLSLAVLQAMLPYQLRLHSDDWLMPWRNLPLSSWKWWGAYAILGIVLFLPEAWVALIGGLAPLTVLEYLLGSLVLFLLAIGILYHQAFSVEKYLIRVGQAYVVIFLAILYGIPWWGLGLGLLAFGAWIFHEEFNAWNGFHGT
ncbi:MAG: hypothetical protein AAF804_01265 [Bacteroidota bacterium]